MIKGIQEIQGPVTTMSFETRDCSLKNMRKMGNRRFAGQPIRDTLN